jgi:hypothetical protein
MCDDELPRDYSDIPQYLVDLQRLTTSLIIAKQSARMVICECKATLAEHAAAMGGMVTWRMLIDDPRFSEMIKDMNRAKVEKAAAVRELARLEGSMEMQANLACVDSSRVTEAACLAARLEREAQSQ